MIIATYELVNKNKKSVLCELDFKEKRIKRIGFVYQQSYSPARKINIFVIKAENINQLELAKKQILKLFTNNISKKIKDKK